ncbi:MAG: NADH-quinone oxidoreductase subunit N [Trueperaceae bacterium]
MTFPPVLNIDWSALAPALALLVTAVVTLFFGLFHKDSRHVAVTALLGVVTAFFFALARFLEPSEQVASFGLRYYGDNLALAFTFVILLGTALAILVSYDQLKRQDLDRPEYYPLMLLSALGAVVMAASGDLVTLVLGLEIMSLPVYVLSAWRTSDRQSQEAGMKYFLLGAFGSAMLIYGMALLYGAGGTFVFEGLAQSLAAGEVTVLATLGGALVLVGLGFKASLAPFHQWAPDVYTGAPTPVVTFMSVVIKVGAFAALLRVVSTVFPLLAPWLPTALAIIVAATLVIGNLSALMQTGVKRILAYSAVAHAGYLGLALLAPDHGGVAAAEFYLTAYALMNVGAFAVLSLMTDANDRGDHLDRFAGLGRRRPWLAATLSIFLLSLGGIPPLAGFDGKILVFQAALDAGWYWLAVLGIITSVVALVYYFRIIAYMYFRESEYEPPAIRSTATNVAIVVALLGTLLLGFFPGLWHNLLDVGQTLIAGF